jgi:hypothetical protein
MKLVIMKILLTHIPVEKCFVTYYCDAISLMLYVIYGAKQQNSGKHTHPLHNINWLLCLVTRLDTHTEN